MIDNIKRDAEKKMQKAVEALQYEMSKIRTGRASSGLLDHVQVDYYGNSTPLNQLATVTHSDARTLLVTPFDKTMVAAVEKAILTSDLGLNPATSGTRIAEPDVAGFKPKSCYVRLSDSCADATFDGRAS